MWIYFFSSDNCKYCPEPKLMLKEFSVDNPEIPVSYKDISDELFKQFDLKKTPSMVVVESDGTIKKCEGRGYVNDWIERLSIIKKLKLTIEF